MDTGSARRWPEAARDRVGNQPAGAARVLKFATIHVNTVTDELSDVLFANGFNQALSMSSVFSPATD